MRGRVGDRGISLVELVVAVLVLSIGVVAGFRGLSQAQRGIGDEIPRLVAHQVALSRAEEQQLLGASAGLPGAIDVGGVTWTIAQETAPTEGGFVEVSIHVKAQGLPGARIVAYAPAGPLQ